MICCTSLLLILGLLGYRQARSPSKYSALQARMAWGFWGGGLATLTYITLVAALLKSGAAVFVDQLSLCLSGVDAAPLAVPAAWIAGRWDIRTAIFLAAAILMLATAVLQLRHAGDGQAYSRSKSKLLGAGVAWLAITLVDHQWFGLYAPVIGAWISDAAIHLPGAALVAISLMKSERQVVRFVRR